MRHPAFAFMLLASAIALPVALSTDIVPRPALAAETELHGSDTQFLAKAILAGRDEVELSQFAAGKAAQPEVRQFAERMVKDHTSMNEKLIDEAQRRKIKLEGTYGTPPLKPTQEVQKVKQQLEALTGMQFDKAYMQHIIQDHLQAIELFKEEARNGKDTPIRNVAEATLPLLEQHLQQAREVGRRVGVES